MQPLPLFILMSETFMTLWRTKVVKLVTKVTGKDVGRHSKAVLACLHEGHIIHSHLTWGSRGSKVTSMTPGLSPDIIIILVNQSTLTWSSSWTHSLVRSAVFDHSYAKVNITCFLMSVQGCLEWAGLPWWGESRKYPGSVILVLIGSISPVIPS